MDSDCENESYIPVLYRSRLYELFGLIEKEFEALFAENLARKFSLYLWYLPCYVGMHLLWLTCNRNGRQIWAHEI